MKKYSNQIEKFLADVSVDTLSTYCQSKGWTVELPGPGVLLFRSPKDEDSQSLEYLVPSQADFDARRKFYNDLLTGIAIVEGTEADEAVQSLLDLGVDPALADQSEVKIRVADPTTTNANHRSSLELKEIEGILSNFKGAIAHSLTLEINKPVPWRSHPLKEASRKAEEFEFGQTQRGSFVLTIRTPRVAAAQSAFLPMPANDEQKSLARLARGLTWISNNPVETIENIPPALVDDGLNANIAEHLFKVSRAVKGRQVELSFGISESIRKELKVESQLFRLSTNIGTRLHTLSRLLSQPLQLKDRSLKVQIKKTISEASSPQTSLIFEIVVETERSSEISFVFWEKKLRILLSTVEELDRAYQYQEQRRAITLHGDFTVERGKLSTSGFRIVWD